MCVALMTRGPSRVIVGSALTALLIAGWLDDLLHSGAFIFAGTANGVDLVTHPQGYTGAGGTLTITVGIDPTSPNASTMVTPVQNIVNAVNNLVPTTGNLVTGGSNNVPTNFFDFESVALHEVIHSLGIAHPNAASESGLSGSNQNYTKATTGVNAVFDLNAGGDGVIGSSDDVRGDDINLHWFRRSNNNPFTIGGTVDSTTYSRDTANLPGGHSFAANADRSVSALLGVPNTEAVMQQGTGSDEAQRTLTHDDVATLRYAMAGLDALAGTSDDYTLTLSYAGLTTSANIVAKFDNTQTGFAVSQSSGVFITGTHARITTTAVFFNNNFNWFFNDQSSACTFTLLPTSQAVTSVGGTFTVTVTTAAGCAWTAVSNAGHLAVTGGSSGTGSGTVTYTVSTNGSGVARSGTLAVAGQTFTVTQGATSFTDDPLVVGSTFVKAVHITELRTQIDALRATYGLAGFSWTDSTLTAGATLVRAVHLTELRTALNQAYTAAGRPLPTYSALGAGTTIRAVNITELRSAVVALE